MILKGLPSLERKYKQYVSKKRKNGQPSLGQTDYIDTSEVNETGGGGVLIQ